MAYSYSVARKQYITEAKVIDATIKEALPPKCTPKSVQDYVLCSAVVITSAKIEIYLETLISNWSKAIISNATMTNTIPLATRAFLLNHSSIEKAYRKFAVRDDESEFLPELGGLIGDPVFLFASDGHQVQDFPTNRLYSNSKYPSPKNIKRLFRRCGIDQAFHRMNKIAKKNVEDMITSFNDIRTEMAHQGMPVGLSAKDVRARINEATMAVGYIDRMFYSHVKQTTGAACWTTQS